MKSLPQDAVLKLIQIESAVRYADAPQHGQPPFVAVVRGSRVILSAPHGAKTFRNNRDEIWHEEDEYTAGMALLLAEICGVSAIATIWRTDDSDPNEHAEERSLYKRELRRLIETVNARWLIDLHGAGEDSPRLSALQKVDLGIGAGDEYLPHEVYANLVGALEKHLGKDAAERNGMPGFRAAGKNRIAAFAHRELGLGAVQVEMKPSVRVALRRVKSSAYRRNSFALDGPYSAPPQDVLGMMNALAEFIGFLETLSRASDASTFVHDEMTP